MLKIVIYRYMNGLYSLRKIENEISKETLFIEGTKIEASANRHIIGQRNSYSKTDNDATFMKLKEDHMKNGQLKPAYNIQFGVDSEYIVWISAVPQLTDTTTLIPFLKNAESYLGFKYPKIIADSGYESEGNYVYLEENKQQSFIKPANYEISKIRKYKNDIGRIDNMDYNDEDDYYLCQNKKKLIVTGTKTRKSKTGYKSKITLLKLNMAT